MTKYSWGGVREFATSVEFLHWRQSEWHSFKSLSERSLPYERGGEENLVSHLFPLFCAERIELDQ